MNISVDDCNYLHTLELLYNACWYIIPESSYDKVRLYKAVEISYR